MPAPRSARALAGLALVSPFVLAGCDKPVPGITVVGEGSSHRIEAACWSQHSSTPVQEQSCTGDGPKVSAGSASRIGISVDKAVRQAGWQVYVSQSGQAQPVTQKTLTESWFRLPLNGGTVPETGVVLQVVAFDESGQQPRGIWKFRLVP
ncbi:hypothetical protein EV189_2958 [Motilibacter rhizosphaerae]|uniref:DUF2771 domain-containing protein n=1 Tax=Motilibacter rhizosphaerae TaxID=598652 RepID=A0A4V2F4G5_9ACTN|nr:hypothetical protein [Motilibacter rhizosphaerae]RZS87527.1 hypothetical protein EV189_2958 [Motilibacter rhizosphaerae]